MSISRPISERGDLLFSLYAIILILNIRLNLLYCHNCHTKISKFLQSHQYLNVRDYTQHSNENIFYMNDNYHIFFFLNVQNERKSFRNESTDVYWFSIYFSAAIQSQLRIVRFFILSWRDRVPLQYARCRKKNLVTLLAQ